MGEKTNNKEVPEWRHVRAYLEKKHIDSITLALLESEKLFLRIVARKAYAGKRLEDKVVHAIRELSNASQLIRAREAVYQLIHTFRFEISDIYTGEDMVQTYKSAIEELIYGDVDAKRLSSFWYRVLPVYYRIFLSRKRVIRWVLWGACIAVGLLFVADTTLGQAFFDYSVDALHGVLRFLLVVAVVVSLLAFVVMSSLVVLESHGKVRRRKKR